MGAGVNATPRPNQEPVSNLRELFPYTADDFGRSPRSQGNEQRSNNTESEQLELARQRIAEQIALEQQTKARAEDEFRQQLGTRPNQEPVSNLRELFPYTADDFGRSPRSQGNEQRSNNQQRSDQEARRRDLDVAARARQDQMIAFEREMTAAKQAEERLRRDAEAARGIRGTEGDARLREEAKLRQEQEAMFETRLREAEAQYRAQANQPGRRVTPEAERQAQMIFEFERARKQAPGSGRDQAIAEFEQRFQGEGQQPAAGITPGPEGAGVLSYQELLNRLKQYQKGMV